MFAIKQLQVMCPLIKADDGVPLPVFIIFLGMIYVEVQAAAFASFEGAVHDQLRHGGKIPQFDEIAI